MIFIDLEMNSNKILILFTILTIKLYLIECNDSNEQNLVENNNRFYAIEGKVIPLVDMSHSMNHFLTNTKIIVNYGQYYGFLKYFIKTITHLLNYFSIIFQFVSQNRSDGSFTVTHLIPGSYLIEISNPDYFYEPIRVDINSKGKIRSRKVNYIQTSAVQQLSYPLKFKSKGQFKYFQIRETWKVTDFIFNPMVLMMVLPLLLIMVLPKMMNAADAETQRVLSSQLIDN